jgi:hypothetical protein
MPRADWISERIEHLRRDPAHQQKVARVREMVANGTFVGQTHTRAELELLANEP